MKVVIILLIILAAAGAAIWKYIQAKKDEAGEFTTLSKLPASVSHTVVQMDPASQSAFFQEYQAKAKRLSVAYALWFFFGCHYLYFRKTGMQIVYWLSWIVVLGFFWWIVDFFRMPSIRRQYNEVVAREALQTLQIGAAFRTTSQPPGAPSAPPTT